MANIDLPMEEQYIKELTNISKRIWAIIKTLQKLELENKKDTQEYISKIEELQKIINLEEIPIMKDIDKNKSLTYDIIDYFAILSKDTSLESILFKIKDDANVNELISLRAYNTLREFITNRTPVIDFYGMLNESLCKDIVNTVLTILNQYLNDINLNDIKEFLLQIKYNLSYVFPFILNPFLKNNFTINTPLFWQSQLITSLMGTTNKDLLELYTNQVEPLLNANLNIILDQYNLNLETIDTKEMVTLAKILIRTTILFISEDKVDSLITKFLLLNEIKEKITDIPSGETQILEALENFPEDRELPQVLTFKRKK